ncbi:MAG TPA: amino acid adenylation domain-containing protein, partial [Pyrinomonadaceae bacterium]
DGWSIGVLIAELTALYRAYHDGQESPLAALPVQYADYAMWQRGWLRGEELERQLAYWRQQLAHAPEALNLPTDRPRPAVLGTAGASEPFRLSAPLVASLKALGQQEGATLYMVLLAGLQVLLSRYTGQTDVSVGAAVSNRNRAEIEGLIGFFVNMLVMRGDLAGDPSFRAYLSRVREVALEAYAHQDVPFEILVESLQAGRSLNRAPLFQVAFVLQNVPTAEPELAGVKLSRVEVDAGRAQFDLSLSLTETPDGAVDGSINYNTELFHAETVERLGEHFRALLEAATAQPAASISALTFLSAQEREGLLVARNRTARAYTLDAPLHALFEAQAEHAPAQTALIDGSLQLSYGELNSRANQLAHLLRARGVGTETVVGLCLRRSVAAVVTLLGVLKAGAAYVSLDPDYTQEHLDFMLADARPALVLTEQALLERVSGAAAETLCLDTFEDALAQQCAENLPRTVASQSLACVLYAATSSGQPKGSVLSHRGLVNRVNWMQETHGLDAGDRFLFKSPLNFDLSALELFWPLSVGAQVFIAQADRQADASYLVACVREHALTSLCFTPATLSAFAAEEGAEHCRSLRRVFCGGEPLTPEALAECASVLSSTPIYQTYGPTETSGAATEWACEEDDAQQRGTIAIGRTIGNMQAYVLDASGAPVPAGVTGELYLGGEGLARGYMHRPGLTAERFVPDAFGKTPGGRLYRTGDLVRYGADGALEYVGRVERQVKLKGYPADLCEIETALRCHARVREAVVLVGEAEGGDERLVAYLVARGQETTADGELRVWMRERVPSYMVPQLFVLLDEMPLTAEGKIDRRALPAAGGQERAGVGRPVKEPTTETEEAVAELWREVLSVERVSVEENFFELGGHSLLATRLMSQVRRRFGVEVALRSFFESPSVEGLARLIESARQARAQSNAPSIKRASRDRYRTNATAQGALALPQALRKQAAQN